MGPYRARNYKHIRCMLYYMILSVDVSMLLNSFTESSLSLTYVGCMTARFRAADLINEVVLMLKLYFVPDLEF